MTIEELLIPRYEVIADYPNNTFGKIGDIITLQSFESEDDFYDWELNKYPHLFRSLHWSEKREISDLPLFVKTTYNGTTNKVDKYDFKTDTIYTEYPEGICKFSLKAYLSARVPATLEEYLTFQDSNK